MPDGSSPTLRVIPKAGLALHYFHLTDDGDRKIVLQSELDGVLDGWTICAKPDLVVIDKTDPEHARDC